MTDLSASIDVGSKNRDLNAVPPSLAITRSPFSGGHPRLSTPFVGTFRDDQGRRYRWYGSNPNPVNLRGYRYRGRYPVLPRVPLTFDASVREIWPDGTVKISRPYIRLDRQPEATRRAYAVKYSIPLHELGLEAEPDPDAVQIA